MDIKKIRKILKERRIDGWLLCDFHQKDLISYRITGLDATKFTSRRWFYFIPQEGTPLKLVSRVESKKLDSLPGEKHLYLSWKQLHDKLAEFLKGKKLIAMQYSPMNNIPSISTVDAGLMELIKKTGVEVTSSADLVAIFEATVSKKGYLLHREAARHLNNIVHLAFEKIAHCVKENGNESEWTIRNFIIDEFVSRSMHYDDPPIVGVDDHPADPHFEPTEETARKFKKGNVVLIDLWARMKDEEAIYADITWCAFIGENPPEEVKKAFSVLINARDEGVEFIKRRFERGQKVSGCEVDDAVRAVIEKEGFGQYFIHRTGHSIGKEVHGSGTNIDNLETRDEREILPSTCFSIEPGIYIEGKFGLRTEINVFITEDRKVEVTTEQQKELIAL